MLLLIVILVPFIFGIFSWQSDRIGIWMPKWLALFGTLILLVLVLFLWVCRLGYFHEISSNFLVQHQLSTWQLEYMCNWIPRFGINVHVAMDGLSLLMLTLSSIIGCMAILSSWDEIRNNQGLFYLNLLWVLGSVIGVFLAMDMFLLFFFWEMMLIPMYFLISLWGHKKVNVSNRVIAGTKFFIYTQLSGLCMLISIITFALFHYRLNGFWSFDYGDLLSIILPVHVEYLLMLGFFMAFAIKMPIVPFHSWLPDFHYHSTVTGAVDLIGILLKTAVYGFFRFTLPLFPSAYQSFAPIAICLGILSIFYGAWMAFVQTEMKRLIAYSNISHMGLILVAIYSNNYISYQGAIIQLISYSLSASGMFIICGQLYNRVYSTDITVMGGLWNRINLMPAFSLCFVVSMLSIPGFGNFIGEIIMLFGIFQVRPVVAIVAVFSVLFTSIYVLRLMHYIYYGINSDFFKSLPNMVLREKFIIIVLLLCLLVIGLFPQFILNTSYVTMQNIYTRLYEYNHII